MIGASECVSAPRDDVAKRRRPTQSELKRKSTCDKSDLHCYPTGQSLPVQLLINNVYLTANAFFTRDVTLSCSQTGNKSGSQNPKRVEMTLVGFHYRVFQRSERTSVHCASARSLSPGPSMTESCPRFSRAFTHAHLRIVLESMLDFLPAELVIRVIEQAALDLRFSATHRQSVVHLASTSHTVYSIVAPILYHTLLINGANKARLQSYMFDEHTQAPAARMCSYVRVLYFAGPRFKFRIRSILGLFVSLERIYSRGRTIRALCRQVNTSQLRHITVVSASFSYDLLKLDFSDRAHVTHACGFLPARMQDTPVVWAHEILNALPGMTQLGLVLVNVESPERSELVHLFKVDFLRIVIQTALKSDAHSLQKVALHVGGRYIERRRGEIEKMVRQINDARVRVWWDERRMYTWDQWHTYEEEDLMEGRDIWTEARGWP